MCLDHRTWSKFLPHVQLALNNSVNLATDFTPNFLMFGRELIFDASLHRFSNSIEDLSQLELGSRDSFVYSLNSLSEIFVKVQNNLFKAYQRNANYYNRGRKVISLSVGDLCWKLSFIQSNAPIYFSAKLAPKFIKCEVVEKVSDNVYVLKVLSRGSIGRYHVKDIVKYLDLPLNLILVLYILIEDGYLIVDG